MGWSRCGPCGDSGAVWVVREGPAVSPLPPRPTVTSTEGAGWSGCSWANGTPSFHSLLPLPPPFPLLFCCSELSLLGSRGPLLSLSTHTQHLKDTSWIWQCQWNEWRLRIEINYLQLSGDTPVTCFQRYLLFTSSKLWKRTYIMIPRFSHWVQSKRLLHSLKAPPQNVDRVLQIVSARYCMGHPAAAPSLWTPGLQPVAAPPPPLTLSFQNKIRQL